MMQNTVVKWLFVVSEGANMPSFGGVHTFLSKILCSGKASNAGGLLLQVGNESKLIAFNWTREEVDDKLKIS